MRSSAPTSRTRLRLKLRSYDIFWAICAPFLALALRDPDLLYPGAFPAKIPETYQYAFVSIFCALASFLFFRISDGMGRFFSIQDAFIICGSVACTVAASSSALFTFTRLEGIPRSTPLIHGLVLSGGLIFTRTAARVFYKEFWTSRDTIDSSAQPPDLRRVILIGVDRFAAAAIKLTEYQKPRTTQVVAALDQRPSTMGRKISGVKIVGLAQDLEAVIDEYVVHGIDVHEVWLSDDASLPPELRDRIAAYCALRGLPFPRISDAFNLAPRSTAGSAPTPDITGDDLNNYFALKRVLDVAAAAGLLIALSPVILLVAGLAFFDVGAPVLFWQQRVGRNGRKFLLYKFRTYHAPFDKHGNHIPDACRLSKIGRAIRASRLDEIPQLFNVLVGDMSLIGPRPLLPHDQPSDPRLRLLVRPGVTGWAQINGGTFITPEEKDALDIWYIRHASLAFDIRILAHTILFALAGEKINRTAIEQALSLRHRKMNYPQAAE